MLGHSGSGVTVSHEILQHRLGPSGSVPRASVSGRLTKINPGRLLPSFPVYLHGQINNHKAQINPRSLRGFLNILAVSVGSPKARASVSQFDCVGYSTAVSPTLPMLTQIRNHRAQDLFAEVFLLLGMG